MADVGNSDRPRGFWPVRHLSGGEIRTRAYDIDVSAGTAIYKGDLVKLESDGNIDVAAAATGSDVIGVASGFEYKNASGSYFYSDSIPATKTGFTGMKAYVWDDPNIVFGAQTSGSIGETAIGELRDHVSGTGNATTKLSGHEVNASGSDAQLKIVGIINRPDNLWGSYVDLEVLINEHHFNRTTGV